MAIDVAIVVIVIEARYHHHDRFPNYPSLNSLMMMMYCFGLFTFALNPATVLLGPILMPS